MSVRKDRQSMIRELIRNDQISTQDELIQKLREKGFEVTQATVSRDIKDLKLIKKVGESGKSVYCLNNDDSDMVSSRYNAILAEALVSSEAAGHICAVKTHSGMANAAAVAIEAMEWDGLVGTIAGDDTVFVLCRDEAGAAKFAETMSGILS
ncbi:MAG: arginine repressor [Acutalibacteraceae bacterium]|nr:arginine repressor [Acutalibacteraceae bacterium]